METKSGLLIKILLNRYHPNYPSTIFKPLPQGQIEALKALDTSLNNPHNGFEKPSNFLKNIHYSWLMLALEKFPLPIQPFVGASLMKNQSDKLFQELNLNPLKQPLPTLTKTYFLDKLYEEIRPPGLLPLKFLPTTPLSGLLKLTKKQLVELIDLLGIYDLASEVRYIINKEQLNKITACLTPKQKQFLRLTLHQKQKLVTSSLNLKQWDGDCNKLSLLLHRRGLIRMSKAISGQHPDAVWYLIHILDRGRGNILKKNYSPQPLPKITTVLIQQVLTLINFLNLKNPKQ